MIQISLKELQRRYVTITCLQKRKPQPKNEKNLAQWVKAGKLQYAKNYPYEEIINPYLNSMEFWTSNNSVPVESGTYRRIGSFEVILNTSELSLISPTWKQILQQCPAQYAVEGIGLCLLHHTKEVDGENQKKTWTVWVMRRQVAGSKHFLSSLSDEELSIFLYLHGLSPDLFSKLVQEIIYNKIDDDFSDNVVTNLEVTKFYLRTVREVLKRQDKIEYYAFLSRSTVLKKIRMLRKEGDVKELLELTDIMKSHPERFWALHNID